MYPIERCSTKLLERYQINKQDIFFAHLLEHVLVEAHQRGRHSEIKMFSYYDRETDQVLLDMGAGRVLRIRRDGIEVRDNGADGVLFMPIPESAAWDYTMDAPEHLVYEKMVEPVNFTGDGTFTVKEQKLLLLLWILSFGFESMMLARPIALAVGPGESGKSSLFRYIGRMLLGPDFEVDSLIQESKQVLTKRPARMATLLGDSRWYRQFVADGIASNIHVGVSVENQYWADQRIPLLLETPAAVRFLSVEPLLKPVDLGPWVAEAGPNDWPVASHDLDWVIVGGESGPGARPCDTDWIRSIVRQCQETCVPVFVKQLGSAWARENGAKDRKSGDMAEWPADLRVREWPKHVSYQTAPA